MCNVFKRINRRIIVFNFPNINNYLKISMMRKILQNSLKTDPPWSLLKWKPPYNVTLLEVARVHKRGFLNSKKTTSFFIDPQQNIYLGFLRFPSHWYRPSLNISPPNMYFWDFGLQDFSQGVFSSVKCNRTWQKQTFTLDLNPRCFCLAAHFLRFGPHLLHVTYLYSTIHTHACWLGICVLYSPGSGLNISPFEIYIF